MTPESSEAGLNPSETVEESEEEEELTNSEEKDEVAVAVPHLESDRPGVGDYVTVMRRRPLGLATSLTKVMRPRIQSRYRYPKSRHRCSAK